MKYLIGTIVLLSLLPAAPAQSQESPGCFMVDSTGRRINLNSLCRGRSNAVAAQSAETERLLGLGAVAYAIEYCEAKEQGKTDRQARTAATNSAFDFLVESGVPTDRMDDNWRQRAWAERLERCPD